MFAVPVLVAAAGLFTAARLIPSGPSAASHGAAAALVGRIGAARVTILGLAVSAGGLAALAFIDDAASYGWVLLPGQILLAIGPSLIFSGSAVFATTHVPEHQAGLAAGGMNTMMELGPTIGLAALMSVAAAQPDRVAGYASAFATVALVCVAAALGGTALTSRGCRHQPSIDAE